MIPPAQEFLLTAPRFAETLPWAIAGTLAIALYRFVAEGLTWETEAHHVEPAGSAGHEALERISLTHQTRSTTDPYDDLAGMGLLSLHRPIEGSWPRQWANPDLDPHGG